MPDTILSNIMSALIPGLSATMGHHNTVCHRDQKLPNGEKPVPRIRQICRVSIAQKMKVRIFNRCGHVASSGILKAKQKLGVTFNSDKLGGIDFTKFSKLSMCSAGTGRCWLVQWPGLPPRDCTWSVLKFL